MGRYQSRKEAALRWNIPGPTSRGEARVGQARFRIDQDEDAELDRVRAELESKLKPDKARPKAQPVVKPKKTKSKAKVAKVEKVKPKDTYEKDFYSEEGE